jgi:hypothetical protein
MPLKGTFQDRLVKILGELGELEAYPDSDPELIQMLRQPIIESVGAQMQAEQMAPMGPEMGPGMGAPSIGPGPAGPPMGPEMMGQMGPPPGAGMSRMPSPGPQIPDAATLERFLAGTQSQNGATV